MWTYIFDNHFRKIAQSPLKQKIASQNMAAPNMVDCVKQWLTLDREITELKSQTKALVSQKKYITQTLIAIMKTDNRDAIAVKHAKLYVETKKTPNALGKKKLVELLNEYYKDDPEKAAELATFLLEKRGKKETQVIEKELVVDDNVSVVSGLTSL